ncbi:MAG: hypothetical protein MJ244_00920 [Clostridia bacterium]|nr:hypothetical protein [Clostridia bacterium]
MILEMQAARLDEIRSVQKVDTNFKPKEKVEKVETESIKAETIKSDIKSTYQTNDIHKKYEAKISALQMADSGLSKDREILTKMEDLVKNTDFTALSHDEKVDIEEKLIKYVDDINKISINQEFDGKPLLDGSYTDSDTDNNKIEVRLERVDSQTLGLSVDNISKVSLDSVRIQGESYMPPYTFDVTEPAGASTALSVIGTAISKIDSYRREVTINISELTRYPECLELDQSAYSAEQAKIRSAEVARRQVEQLQNAIRYEINLAQRSQKIEPNRNVVDLFLNN